MVFLSIVMVEVIQGALASAGRSDFEHQPVSVNGVFCYELGNPGKRTINKFSRLHCFTLVIATITDTI